MRLWMLSATTMTAAAAMGLALGGYVTSPQRSPLERPDDPYGATQASEAAPAPADPGPTEIHCTGCGPTLADRHYAAQMAGLDGDGMISGSDDPVVRDYLSESPDVPSVTEVPPPSPPVSVVRFADSAPVAARTVPVAVVPTQSGAGQADAEQAPPIVPTSPQ
ncbi:hypothetical protein DM806_19065 [Sphingobium lactosutens]|uniref:hypothetical protein n=1 Tax=Sphingobium lactosutens TaxID=522773 RepID=UPI0015BCE241|nr:hypothetical protein [Sphingobium lactosutens]NWK97717.1 hypothetical protein [Sphingobium lactosutens]